MFVQQCILVCVVILLHFVSSVVVCHLRSSPSIFAGLCMCVLCVLW